MITGDKALPAHTPSSADGWLQRVFAVVLAAAVAAGVYWVVQLGA
jgi:hypothetical protein